jgi:hypothetical protein
LHGIKAGSGWSLDPGCIVLVTFYACRQACRGKAMNHSILRLRIVLPDKHIHPTLLKPRSSSPNTKDANMFIPVEYVTRRSSGNLEEPYDNAAESSLQEGRFRKWKS